jgi:NAD(P)-dependent dehydrogenase (short-subunit alcohol dehydrogenase family)
MGDGKLMNRNVVVLGASRGIGREIVRRAAAEDAQVLAVARGREDLQRLRLEIASLRTLALDASADEAPSQVFAALRPDVLVICGGATPTPKPLHELSWREFAAPWDSDVRASFLFCGYALRAPLLAGSTVILISSGAGLGGSPLSGGYAGAKRMQMFMASYGQKESNRLGLGIRFAALVPLRIMPETQLGKVAVEGYARYLGIQPAEFIQGMANRHSTVDVAEAVIRIAVRDTASEETILSLSADGLAALQ